MSENGKGDPGRLGEKGTRTTRQAVVVQSCLFNIKDTWAILDRVRGQEVVWFGRAAGFLARAGIRS